MNDIEFISRVITAVLVVIISVTRLYCSFSSARVEAEGMIIRGEDHPVSGWIILFSATSIISILAFTINPDLLKWSFISLPESLRWTGAGLGTMGLILLLWSHHALGRNFFAGLRVRKHHELITSGPYRWVRHPMYLAFLLLGAGFTLLTTSWFIGGCWCASYMIMLANRLMNEEDMLCRLFGDQYMTYRALTGSFLPRLWRKR